MLTISQRALLTLLCMEQLICSFRIILDDKIDDISSDNIIKSTLTLENEKKINRGLCFQKRYFTEEFQKQYRLKCGQSLVDNFCDNIQCSMIKSCPKGSVLLENIVGHGCCPACVKLIGK